MARRAAVISIDVTAGNAKMLAQLQQSKAALHAFGQAGQSAMSGTVSEARATHAALHTLEGGIQGNTRAVAAFVEKVLGAGPAMQTLFPLIGGLAFVGMIASVTGKVVDFFAKMGDAPKKIAKGFEEINAPLRLVNTELELSNAKLEDQIAKLQGKPQQNGLKVALLEAQEAAEKLAASLDKDIAKATEALSKSGISKWRAAFTGEQSTDYIKDYFDKMQSRINQIRQATGGNGAAYSEAMMAEKGPLWEAMHWAEKRQTPPSSLWGQPTTTEQRSDWKKGHAGEQGALQQFEVMVSEQMTQFAESGKGAGLKAQEYGLKEAAAAAKKYQEAVERLKEMLAKSEEAELSGVAKVNVARLEEISKLGALYKAHADIRDLVAHIYANQAQKASEVELDKKAKEALEGRDTAYDKEVKKNKEAMEAINKDTTWAVEEGKKKMEALAKALTSVVEQSLKLRAASAEQATSHQVRMIGLIATPGDPLGTLAKQQDVEKEAILKRYREQMALLSLEYKDQLLTRHQLLAAGERDVALAKLHNETEALRAEIDKPQAGMRAFFLDMQRDAQETWNIFYEASHAAVDKISGEMAKLFTWQKTNLGAMLKGLGEDMLQKSIKSGFTRGLGALGGLFGIHEGAPVFDPSGKRGDSPSSPLYVQNVGDAGSA